MIKNIRKIIWRGAGKIRDKEHLNTIILNKCVNNYTFQILFDNTPKPTGLTHKEIMCAITSATDATTHDSLNTFVPMAALFHPAFGMKATLRFLHG